MGLTPPQLSPTADTQTTTCFPSSASQWRHAQTTTTSTSTAHQVNRSIVIRPMSLLLRQTTLPPPWRSGATLTSRPTMSTTGTTTNTGTGGGEKIKIFASLGLTVRTRLRASSQIIRNCTTDQPAWWVFTTRRCHLMGVEIEINNGFYMFNF